MAGETALGAKTHVVFAPESVWGVREGTPVGKIIPHVSDTLDANQGMIEPNTLRPDRRFSAPIQGNIAPAGDVNVEFTANGHGLLMYYLLGGTPTPSGSGPFVHVIEEGLQTDLPSFTIEKGYTDIEQYIQYDGGRLSQATLLFEPESLITGAITLGAKNELGDASSIDDEPEDPVFLPLNSYEGFIKEGATVGAAAALANVTRAELTLNNNLFPQNIVGSRFLGLLLAQRLRVSAAVELFFADLVLYNQFRNFTQRAYSIQAADPTGNYIQFDFYATVATSSTPQTGGEGPIFLPAEVIGFVDPTTGKQVTCTVQNDIADLTV
jgi:hypothetical protein